jgi:hypothetical protein
MFQAAQAKPKPQAPVDDASADALLGDILGGLGDGSGSGFAPKCVQPSLLSWMGPHISYVEAELVSAKKLCVAVLLANGTAAATFLPHAAHNPTRLLACPLCLLQGKHWCGAAPFNRSLSQARPARSWPHCASRTFQQHTQGCQLCSAVGGQSEGSKLPKHWRWRGAANTTCSSGTTGASGSGRGCS